MEGQVILLAQLALPRAVKFESQFFPKTPLKNQTFKSTQRDTLQKIL